MLNHMWNYIEHYVDRDIAEKFADSLVQHVANVREAGKMVGVDENLLAIHDNSKWSLDEFPAYAKQFFGGGDPEFSYAWLHHIHHNPHHWQYWMFPDGYSYGDKYPMNEKGALKMPHRYVLEMVADWMGASKAYTGSWDMTEWLIKNMPKIVLHSETAAALREILDHQGYSDIVYTHKFARELP